MPSIRDIRTAGRGGSGRNRELQRLSRQDLLELLVGQMREGDEPRDAMEQKDRDLRDQGELVAHLKERLDLKDERIGCLREQLGDKDAQIAHLRDRLDDKDAQMAKLKRRLDEKDSLIARIVATGDLDPTAVAIFEACQHAREATEDDG